jgi:hypothetical protein
MTGRKLKDSLDGTVREGFVQTDARSRNASCSAYRCESCRQGLSQKVNKRSSRSYLTSCEEKSGVAGYLPLI